MDDVRYLQKVRNVNFLVINKYGHAENNLF